jgi:hypothetical protein
MHHFQGLDSGHSRSRLSSRPPSCSGGVWCCHRQPGRPRLQLVKRGCRSALEGGGQQDERGRSCGRASVQRSTRCQRHGWLGSCSGSQRPLKQLDLLPQAAFNRGHDTCGGFRPKPRLNRIIRYRRRARDHNLIKSARIPSGVPRSPQQFAASSAALCRARPLSRPHPTGGL